MTQPQTTITYRGKEYPFYKTNRGSFNFENAGFTTDDILKLKVSAMLAMVYYQLVECAKRAGTPITDTFEDFIDNSDPDITDVFTRLKKAEQNTKKQ